MTCALKSCDNKSTVFIRALEQSSHIGVCEEHLPALLKAAKASGVKFQVDLP